MRDKLIKHRVLVIVLATIIAIFAVDRVIWIRDISANKKNIEAIVPSIIEGRTAVSQGVYNECRVSTNKSVKATSCSVMQDVVITPDTDMRSELALIFGRLESQSWDTNFKVFKTELIEGKSRFQNQAIRFYRDDYDPNGDLDFIDVYRIDNGLTLKNMGAHVANNTGSDTDVILLRFYRYQRSSLGHYVVGQFINY